MKENSETTMKPWKPLEDLPKKLYLEGLYDDYSGLKLIMKGKDKTTQTLHIHFDNHLSYKNTDESERLRTLNKHTILSSGQFPFLIHENSEYIKWLKKESLETIEEELIHLIICTPNDIVDVICTDLPDVSWK